MNTVQGSDASKPISMVVLSDADNRLHDSIRRRDTNYKENGLAFPLAASSISHSQGGTISILVDGLGPTARHISGKSPISRLAPLSTGHLTVLGNRSLGVWRWH